MRATACLILQLQGMEKFNFGTPVVRAMDGRQPKPLLLQHVSSVQHGSTECNGNGATKHGPKCHAPLATRHHCDPSTTRSFSPPTERPIWKPNKHNTNTSSLIDVFWIPGSTRTVSTLPALSHIDWNVQLVLLSFCPQS